MLARILKSIGIGFGYTSLILALVGGLVYLLVLLTDYFTSVFGFNVYTAVVLPMFVMIGAIFSTGVYVVLRNE